MKGEAMRLEGGGERSAIMRLLPEKKKRKE